MRCAGAPRRGEMRARRGVAAHSSALRRVAVVLRALVRSGFALDRAGTWRWRVVVELATDDDGRARCAVRVERATVRAAETRLEVAVRAASMLAV